MSVTSIKDKTADAVTAPRELLPLLREYAGTTGVITSRCYTDDQPAAFADLRAAYPDALVNISPQLETVSLTLILEDIPVRIVFELREVGDLLEGPGSE